MKTKFLNKLINIDNDIVLSLKPEYLIHKYISGNKFRKLKYNLEKAKELKLETLLTFGGAYSNHLVAVAAAGKDYGFKTIGVIRGEELEEKVNVNPTLKLCKEFGMHFHFESRNRYQEKHKKKYLEGLKLEYGDFYLLPEGGTNDLAIKGCEEILSEVDNQFDYICCSVGTGGTISGLINSSLDHQKVLGFPALKGSFLKDEITKWTSKNNWQLITDYHFGGYAKINTDLITFINWFKAVYNIPLDPIYTGKMVYGIFDLMKKNFFESDSKILIIHTGGLQGISGMNLLLEKKKMPLIDY